MVSDAYTVRPRYFSFIIRHFGVRPTVDAFASGSNHVCPRWWGEGSPWGADAFAHSWGGQGTLWLNPPFDLMSPVLAKVREDQAHAIFVMPDWGVKAWHSDALRMRRADILFPTGSKFFLRDGNLCQGTRWDTRVVLLCGHTPKCPDQSTTTFVSYRERHVVTFDLTPHLHFIAPLPHDALGAYEGGRCRVIHFMGAMSQIVAQF